MTKAKAKVSETVNTVQQSLTDLHAIRVLTSRMTKTALRHLEKALDEMSGHGLTAYDIWKLTKEINSTE